MSKIEALNLLKAQLDNLKSLLINQTRVAFDSYVILFNVLLVEVIIKTINIDIIDKYNLVIVITIHLKKTVMLTIIIWGGWISITTDGMNNRTNETELLMLSLNLLGN